MVDLVGAGREEKSETLGAAERDELVRLRRENKQLRVERDILSRAAAWFARETGAVAPGSSSS
jgi:transposase